MKDLKFEIKKRSVTIGNHRTSISIENEFWNELKKLSDYQKISLNKLILKIDNEKPKDYGNLSSYIRVWILQNLKIKIMKFL